MWKILIATDRQVSGEDGREGTEDYGNQSRNDGPLHQVQAARFSFRAS